MSEKDLNIKYICNKTLLDEKDELVPIILEMIQESYKAGLCQAEFDNTMELIEENVELKKKLNELQKPQIFIDTQDIEERYGEEKYQDYLEEQVKELKKELEEYKYSHSCSFVDTCKNVKIANYEQQQEFIKYLEDCIKELEEAKKYPIEFYESNLLIKKFNVILQKYKEIIGNDINVGSKGVKNGQ